MAKPQCTQKAEWRFLPGKPAQQLSPYYRLGCDYGTSLVAMFKEGESGDPLYLCAEHATQVKPSNERRAALRPVAPEPKAPEPKAAELTAAGLNVADPQADAEIVHPSQAVAPAVRMLLDVPADLLYAKPAIVSTPAESSAHLLIEALPESVTEPVIEQAPERAPKQVPKQVIDPPRRILSAVPAAQTPAKPVRMGREAPSRAPARDLAYGNPAKALVDEAIWNMATGDFEIYANALREGKTVAEAAQAAGGQLAIIHRKISEYTYKIEAMLSESKARIGVAGAIDKPFEDAVQEIISNGAMAEAEKDAAVDQLGAAQEWIKHGLDREITPLHAHRVARAVADRANWGAAASTSEQPASGQSASEQLNPAYRSVYLSLRDAVRAAVPLAQTLDERLSNLHAAKCDLENAPAAKSLRLPAEVSIAS